MDAARINGCNPDMMKVCTANMDIHHVLDSYSCMYMLSYVSKPEHEMNIFLKTIILMNGVFYYI